MNEKREGERKQEKAAETTSQRYSKQVSNPLMVNEHDVNSLPPQLIKFFQGRASSVCRDHSQITLSDNDGFQASADPGEYQNMRDVPPQDPRSHWSKTQDAERTGTRWRRRFQSLDDRFHGTGRAKRTGQS